MSGEKMKKKKYGMIGLLLVFVLTIGLVSACGKAEPVAEVSSETSLQEEAISEEAVVATETEVLEEVALANTEKEIQKSEVVAPPKETPLTDTTKKPHELGTFVLYFSGIDVWGWTDIKSRSDVNIIAVVNTNTRHIQLINTPRDYYVALPISNGAKDKLTHAGLYGVENSKGALEMLYGVDIDYYVRMNFSGFEKIIDTMGGVDVYSEYDFTVEPIKHYEKGYNHLTGLEALAFVRERHAFASGDNQRGRNQMALVQAMIKKVCSIDFLKNYEKIMGELTDFYRTNVNSELVASLIFNQMTDSTAWRVDTFSVTGTGGKEATYSAPKSVGYVMHPNKDDVAKATELMNAVLNEKN